MKRKIFLFLLVFVIMITKYTSFASSSNSEDELTLNNTDTYIIRPTPDKQIKPEDIPNINNEISISRHNIEPEINEANTIVAYKSNEITFQSYFNNYNKTNNTILSRATLQGWLDTVNHERIAGWVWDSDRPNTPINVHIYINNMTTSQSFGPYEFAADQFRQDLLNQGYGNGYHGFNLTVDWNSFPSGGYVVRVYGIGGNNPELNNSPKGYSVMTPEGVLETVDSSKIKGWTWRGSEPNEPINIRIYLTNVPQNIAFGPYDVPADWFRQDLLNQGYGNGYHGFDVGVDWPSFPVGPYSVLTYGVGVNYQLQPAYYILNNSPKTWNFTTSVNNYWCIDSGKHLDWDGTTKYLNEWNDAVATWNNYKPGVIRKDIFGTIEDIKIEDVPSIAEGYPAATFYPALPSTGKRTATIQFSDYHMQNYSYESRKVTCMHEIGHTLGLAHNSNFYESIMYPTYAMNSSGGNLHNEDKLNYDYMYNNKY